MNESTPFKMSSGGPFRKFSLSDVSTQNSVKSSVQRGIRGAAIRGGEKKKEACFFLSFNFDRLAALLLSTFSTSTFELSLFQKTKTAKVCELYPSLEETGAIDDIMPKKEQGNIAKW